MDYKKSTAPTNTVTRDVMNLCKDTDNIYESIAIIAKRANQISADIKTELNKKIALAFKFCGPLDMDFFIKDGEYLLSEVNPRFGGAYLHAYGAGVDFFPLIWNNMNSIENESIIGQYDDDILMLMYDDVVIRKKSELVNDNFSLI